MIPSSIAPAHIEEAIRRILRDGVPPGRRSRGYCLATEGKHLPPKYTIALAHQVATGQFLDSDRFSGGPESNEFLRRRGFAVVECACRGTVPDGSDTPVSRPHDKRTPPPLRTWTPVSPVARHSERCRMCKARIAQLLERIYGACQLNLRFGWQTRLEAYAGTPIASVLRDVAEVLQGYRGHGIEAFVRSNVLAPCDYWIPDPGFIVEFDESQHFTRPRKLALSAYAETPMLGFSARRWMELCNRHDAKDNDPLFRDEQRAWYDTLRDLVPPTQGFQPTVRLYASDQIWCSLDPDNREDRERFSRLIHGTGSRSSRTAVDVPSLVSRPKPLPDSTVRVAIVFPAVAQKSSNGVPPSGPGAQQPDVPTADSFAGEAVDFVLFPEGYVSVTDRERGESLSKLAAELDAPLLVGAIDTTVDSTGRAWQVLLRFDPDGSHSQLYAKHSTADAVAFERPDWEATAALPTFPLGGVRVGTTICHDHYLGLLPRYLARNGAQIWVNPSFDNVTDIKWSSILRLRAVENRFFALCTLHYDVARKRTHPFGFAPDGTELSARPAGWGIKQPLSECSEADSIYVVDLDVAAVGEPLDWAKIPSADKPRRPRKGTPLKPIRVTLHDGQPAVLGGSGRDRTDAGFQVETVHGPVYVGVVPNEQILDAAACFQVLDRAARMYAYPIIWNRWERLPADSASLATLMLGRAIECCAPIVLSDGTTIHELVELANRVKIPTRREIEPSGEAIVDLGYAWGLDNAFRIVTKHLPSGMRRTAVERYRSLGGE